MKQFSLTLLPEGRVIPAQEGQTLQQALLAAQVQTDAPCGGKGTCGTCRCVSDGVSVLACQTLGTHVMTVRLPEKEHTEVLTRGAHAQVRPDGDAD